MDDADGARQAPVTESEILAWLENISTAVRAGELGAADLVRLLGQLRQASAACADASDWVLLAAREQGVSLRRLAPAFGKGYVRAPAARLEKLHRQALNPDQWLEILRGRAGRYDEIV